MQYVEDSSPLVSVPELMDDATGLVIPGPRTPQPPTPSVVAPRPGRVGRAPEARAAVRRDATTSSAVVAAATHACGLRRARCRHHVVRLAVGDSASAVEPIGIAAGVRPRSPKPAPPNLDEVEQTRVVPAPGRTGLRPKAEPMQTGAGRAHVRATSTGDVSAASPGDTHGGTTAADGAHRGPAAPRDAHGCAAAAGAAGRRHRRTDVRRAGAATARARRTATVAPALSNVEGLPARDTAREARALAMAVAAIAAFLGSASVSQPAADAIKTLERDLASAAPPADLVAALKGLAARLGAAANELT